MNNNGWPLSRKKTVRLLVALTIVVWATETLLAQWGLGAESPVPRNALAPEVSTDLEEKFVPGSARLTPGVTIELRNEATVVGEEVRLKQVARWTQQDEAILAPLGDLVLARIGTGAPFLGVSVDQIKQTLHDAGINVAAMNFVGATTCTVNRSDVEYDERVALEQWIGARQAAATPATQPQEPSCAAAEGSAPGGVRTLRDLLVTELAERLALPRQSLQVDFQKQDEHLLNLPETLFRFEIEPVRRRNALGEVSWLVLIVAGDDVQKATVSARARAWQEQVVLSRPLAFKQVIEASDLIDRRTLVDQLVDEPLLARPDAIGQQAARELRAGTVLTSRMVEPAQLVKAGQFVTISLAQGAVQIRTVARALESGSQGQTIHVRNDTTREVFQVMLTGPQTATMNLTASATSGPGNLASAGN